MRNLFLSMALACSVLANANYQNNSKSNKSYPNEIGTNTAQCSELKIAVVFDNYGSETSWDLKNAAGDIIESGGGYSNSSPDISKNVCLTDGAYTFTINDSYGDGICCTYGQGSYAITLNGTALISGGAFGTTESKSFSIGKASPPPNPTNLVASNIKSTSALLSWQTQEDVSNLITFDIYNDSKIIKSVTGAKTVTLDKLTPETTYNLSVKAKNVEGDQSLFSNSIQITTAKRPKGGEVSQELLDLLDLVNAARANDGKNPLKLDTKLIAAAEVHANDMNDNNIFSHTGSDGSSVSDRVNRQDYSWNAVAENIANGQRNAQQVHDAWMNSPGHRTNILNARYTEIGLSRVANLWVQVFANPSNAFQFKNNDIAKNNTQEEELEMYPNLLNKSQNTITVSGHQPHTSYSIYSITGQRVQYGKITDTKITLKNPKSGMYIINFISGQQNITKRFIKK